jgi:CRP-like cAMP-binding protein/predicted MFS family arabinose efflux permease
MTAGPSKGRFRDALKSRDLRLLTASFVIDGLGSWAYVTVIIVYVFERTGSTSWIALVTASRWIPALLTASYGGVLADRYERTRLMITSALLSFTAMAGIALVVAVDGPLVIILLLSACSAIVSSPYRPAAGALTPEVVPETDLTAANGLFSALESAVVVVGPGVGGLLLLTDEPAAAIQLNALSFLFAALLLFRLQVRSRGDVPEEGQSAYRAFRDGVSALRSHHVATVLVLFCALDSAVYGASTVLFVPISEQLGTGSNGFGYLLAGSALGGVIAAGLANRLSASRRLAPIIVGGIALQAVPFALTTFAHQPAVGFALQVVAGIGMIIVDVLAITALQRDMARGVLGRVLSLLDVAVVLAILVSSFVFAGLLSRLDLHPTLFVLGIGFPVIALLGIGPLVRADRNTVEKMRMLEPRIALLQVLDLFAAASRQVLERLADSIEIVEMADATDVVREGDPADALWIISNGEVSVTVDGTFVRTMGPRSYFGEIGLLRGIPRTATVRTTEPCVLWKLSGEDFLDAVQANTASASLLGTAFARLSRTHPHLAVDDTLSEAS